MDAASSGIAAIVLAAGLSRRMAPRNKLLLTDAAGHAMVARVADAACRSRAHPVIVVTGHEAASVEAALAGLAVTVVQAADHATGLSASLRAGVRALPADATGALICLGDMPLITPALLDRLIAAHDPAHGRRIVVPVCAGRRGNPVLWDREFFAGMMALTGDAGARSLLARLAGSVCEVETSDAAVLRDFDTPECVWGSDWVTGLPPVQP